MKRLFAVIIAALVLTSAPRAQDSPLVSAMQDELKRSMAELRMKDQPAPYYIDYTVDDATTTRLLARLGSVVDESSDRLRTLAVDVRVGDYAFDSSRFQTMDRGAGVVPSGESLLPLDDEYDTIRRQIWLVTDATYKRAVNVFAKKKAAFQNRASADQLPDLSRESSTDAVLPQPAAARANRDWADRARQISAVFASTPDIFSSDVSVIETRGMHYFVSSEGSKVVTPVRAASLRVVAETQAADGMVLRDFFTVVKNSLQEMPPAADLVSRARDLAARLAARRTAPVGDEFTGPVLVEGQASAELLGQTLVPLMLARRPMDGESPRMQQAAQSQTNPFLSRIGLRVLPEEFSASDSPSLDTFDGQPVPGAYAVDDEGVRAKDVTLVENGKLVTLLAGRTPQKNLLQSNGHGRGNQVQAGVFQLKSAHGVSGAELKQKYLDLLKTQDKPFGYIVRGLANPAALQLAPTDTGDVLAMMQGGGGGGGPLMLQVVKVTPDGKEELVRGLRFAPIAAPTFRNILDASSERLLYSYRATGGTVSVIVPSLIFEELEVQRTKDVLQRPPRVPSPIK